jgi:D-threo-aldose 1-dehydrogenase
MLPRKTLEEAMDPFARRRLGRSALELPVLGLGGAPFGDLFSEIGEANALATIAHGCALGIRYFDSAPWYGCGKSEHRLGHVLRQRPQRDFLVSTKIGRVLVRPADPARYRPPMWTGGLPFEVRFDYSYDGVMRSYEDSLQRLGLNRVDLLVIHDLDLGYHGTRERVAFHLDRLDRGGGWRALGELKAAGEIKAIGAGVNERGTIPDFVGRFDLDFFLVAMPYTLLDQAVLDDEFLSCRERGIGFIIGSVFASGILITGASENATYAYRPAPPEMMERVRRIEAVCRRHETPLAAAALQFPLGHPAVAAIIPGAAAPEHLDQTVEFLRRPIPRDLWAELKHERLIHPEAPTPD